MSAKRSDLVCGLAVVAIAFLVYLNSLGNGFVWDDDVVILGNPALKGNPLALFSGIDSGRVTESAPYYRPLTLLSFMAERTIHEFNPLFVRFFNVFLHAVNSFLVYRFARLSVPQRAALLAAVLFAVHPLNAEAVNFNAGGRNTLLATFFVLCTYLVHHRAARSASLAWTGAGTLLFLAGVMSKEIALAVLPFVCLLEIDAWHGGGSGRHENFFRVVPYVSVAIIYLGLRHHALSQSGVVTDVFTGLFTRLFDNVFIIPRYLLNIVWPGKLSPRYFIPDDLNLFALQLVIAWLCIGGVGGWLFKKCRSRASLLGIAWLVAFWLPVSGIFPIPSAPLADRYLYLPAIGVWLILADQAETVMAMERLPRTLLQGVAAAVALAFAVVTLNLNVTWHDDIRLFTRLVSFYPERAYGYHNLGCAYLDKAKNLELAEQSFEKALAIDPFFPRLRTQMGYVRFQRGDLEGALEQYRHALVINPQDAEALVKQGEALELTGRKIEALDSYRRFLALPVNDLPLAVPGVTQRVKDLEHAR